MLKIFKIYIVIISISLVSCGSSVAEEGKQNLPKDYPHTDFPTTKYLTTNTANDINVKLSNTRQLSKKELKKTNCDPFNKICIDSFLTNQSIIAEIYNNAIETRTAQVNVWRNNMFQKLFIKDIKQIILEPSQRIKLAELLPIDPEQIYGYNFTFDSQRGAIDAVHNDDFVYDLPFETNKSYKILQTYGGKFSHNNEENYYSYDFKMKPGESVTAARGGKIIEVVDGFRYGGTSRKLIGKANYIYIEHDDKTIGVYTHLKHKGVLVKEGDEVQKGQKIALSGNTGFSDTPHLHFSVSKFLKEERLKSIPIKIKTKSGILTKLLKYEKYTKL